ncbi:MAG TPA: CHAD domain-containing protein [Acidimicrobiales bacterium]|nr:CHAD domain-containing protein [Acidimicrobiales bacterium]
MGTSEPVEIEWQFDALDLRPVERWLATLPTLSLEADDQRTITALAKTPRRLVDSYVDTDDWRMAGAGFVVRTRRRGRHDEVTLKDTRAAEESGLRRRLEVTETLPPAGVGALGPDGPVGRRVHAIAGRRRLSEVLEVRTRRRPFSLRVGGVDAAEVSLDDTVVVVGSGHRPLHLRRVEVEVLPEWVDALEPIVAQLRSSCGLQPATLSKFEAGLLAVGVEIPGPPDLGGTEVSPDATMGELAYAVLRRQLAVLRQKEPGTRLGEDPEDLHDMRVATRRLRAALDLFADILPVRARSYRDELGWVASVLGAVRDLDVQQEGLGEMATALVDWGMLLGDGSHDPLADLADLLDRERDAARSAMLAGLDSARWERLVNGMAALVRQGPLRRSVATRSPAVIGVPDLVVARHDAVVQAARKAKKSGQAADFHRLRKRCKKLRYSLEFSSELYAGRTARYIRRLTVLQDRLGLMQDAEVAAGRLADLATGQAHLPSSTVFVMGGVAAHHRRNVARFLRRLPKDVSRVGGREWKDLTSIMERRRSQALTAPVPAPRALTAVPMPETLPETEPAPRVATLVPPPASGQGE